MAKKPLELSALELHALKIAGKKADDVREDLEADTDPQPVDFLLHITGEITVAGDSDYIGQLKPELGDVLALTLSTLGPRARKQLADDLSTAYAKAPAGESPAVHTDHREAAEKLLRKLNRPEEKHRRGAVGGIIKLEKLRR